VCKDGRVFAIDFDFYSFSSKLMCFNADTGVLLWDNPFGGYSVAFGTPAVSQDSVFIYVIEFYSYFMGMYKFFVNGTLDWKVPIPGYIYMFFSISPVCSANKVFICSSDYYGYNNINTIYCMEIENGNILWSYNLDDISMVDLSIADERVYTADYTGNIYSFEDILKIKKISGGILCVKAEVKNNGESDFTNLSWDIDVVGGIFDMINKSAYGNIPTLQAGKSKTVRAFPVFGLGNVEIEVKVSMPGVTPIRKSLNGLVLGLIVIVKS
jgi:outer membrane protein assembly factor BamB